MATNQQRTTAICDALINGTSTTEQQTKLAMALYATIPGKPFAQLTNAEKAAIIPKIFYSIALDRIREYDKDVAIANVADPRTQLLENP